MHRTITIIPAINEKTKLRLLTKLRIAQTLSKLIHVDICDGKFASHKTVSLSAVPGLRAHKWIIHYMGIHPLQAVARLPLGTSEFIFHYEAAHNGVDEIIAACLREKVKPILAINPETNVARIKKYLPKLYGVHVLTVHPGMSGQKMIISCLRKTISLRKLNSTIVICIDGGVNATTATLVSKYPVNRVCVTSAIFDAVDTKLAYNTLKHALNR